MPNNTEVISCDLFSILSSLNFSVEDITGLTPAKFRKGLSCMQKYLQARPREQLIFPFNYSRIVFQVK
nr:hypothetical protein [Salmonella sp.]